MTALDVARAVKAYKAYYAVQRTMERRGRALDAAVGRLNGNEVETYMQQCEEFDRTNTERESPMAGMQ